MALTTIEGQVNTEMLHLVLYPPFDPRPGNLRS